MQLGEAEVGTASTDGEAGSGNWRKPAPGASLQILTGIPILFLLFSSRNTLLMRNPAELFPWGKLSP